MSIKMVAVGDVNIDFIYLVDSIPERAEEVRASSLEIHAGGSAANTSVAAQRLGLKSGFIGRIGSDFFWDFLEKEFREGGVDIRELQKDEEVNSGHMVILVTPDGERTMICDRSANTRLDPEKIDTDYVREADYLHISGYTFIKSPQRDAGKRIIEAATEEGLQISLDPGVLALKEARKEVESIMPSVDMLFVNKQELDMLSNLRDRERAGRQLLDRGPSIVALKMGYVFSFDS